MKKINWGFIGCGSVTEVKSGPAFQMCEHFHVKGVYRRNHALALDYASRHRIPKVYNSAEQLIDDPQIDAVYIATPPDSHKDYALQVARAGKITVIEKPLAPTYTEAKIIIETFKEKDIPLFVSYYRRSLPRFQKIKTWIEQDKIGEIRYIQWEMTKPASAWDKEKKAQWRTNAEIAPAGYFDDLASHGLDLFIYLLGDITSANGISTNQQGLYTSKDAVSGNWMHKNGILGAAIWNFGNHQRTDKVKISGSEGELNFSVFAEEPIILIKDGKRTETFIENPKHIQQYHVANIWEALVHKKEHPSTGKTGLHTAWVMQQILGGKV